MITKAPIRLAIIISIVLITSNCAYLDRIRQETNYLKIENNISISRLEEAEKFIGKAPLSKAYRFSFSNTQNKSFSLVFTVHESSFSKSTLTYRKANALHRNADQIDGNVRILTALDKSLPQTDEISWKALDQLPTQEAQDSYQIMLEYIRFKIRDSLQP